MSDGDRYSEENLSRALGLQSTSSVGEEAVLYRMGQGAGHATIQGESVVGKGSRAGGAQGSARQPVWWKQCNRGRDNGARKYRVSWAIVRRLLLLCLRWEYTAWF